MKKILRYFPNRKIALILILFLIIALTMKQGYCLSTDDWGTQKFTDEFATCLEKITTFDNFVYWNASTTSTPTATNNITVCLFYNNVSYKVGINNLQYYKDSSVTWNNMKCINTKIDNCNLEPIGTNIISSLPTMNSANYLPFNNNKTYYSTIDIEGTGSYHFIKNMNYTKPTCPICEECAECPSEGEEGECGPVEITNFPIDKNEFYVLLLILSTLIFMLFFKWCFPMKGGKK